MQNQKKPTKKKIEISRNIKRKNKQVTTIIRSKTQKQKVKDVNRGRYFETTK